MHCKFGSRCRREATCVVLHKWNGRRKPVCDECASAIGSALDRHITGLTEAAERKTGKPIAALPAHGLRGLVAVLQNARERAAQNYAIEPLLLNPRSRQ